MNVVHVTVLLACFTLSDARKKKKVVNSATIADKCEKWVGKFDQCLSMGYQPRHFKRCQEIFDRELEGKDQKSCRRTEIRIKKKCSYTCISLPMTGGVNEVSVTDEDVVRVADIAVTELKDRASRQGSLDEDSSIIRGEIVKAMYQIVSGKRYLITMKLGITDKMECKEAAKDQIVSFTDCSLEEKMGTYHFSVIYAPWRTPQYEFEVFEDIDGPEMKEKYWGKSVQETY